MTKTTLCHVKSDERRVMSVGMLFMRKVFMLKGDK